MKLAIGYILSYEQYNSLLPGIVRLHAVDFHEMKDGSYLFGKILADDYSQNCWYSFDKINKEREKIERKAAAADIAGLFDSPECGLWYLSND